MSYLSLNEYLRITFGTKVYKLSLSTGCVCPNRDGRCGTGGCSFCSEGGSGEFAESGNIDEQIEKAKLRVNKKFPKGIAASDRKYIAYFQSYTNTYGDVGRLEEIFSKAAGREDIVALSVGTRPDCLSAPVLDMLSRLNKIKPVWVELGLQTVHDETARAFNRGYDLKVFEEAYSNLKSLNLSVIVHVMLYLPGESRDDMLETVRYLSSLSPRLDGIKLHLLQVLKGTSLADEYGEKPFYLPDLDEYCALVADCLALLPKETVIHRLTGDGAKKLLIAPLWCADKKRVINRLRDFLR